MYMYANRVIDQWTVYNRGKMPVLRHKKLMIPHIVKCKSVLSIHIAQVQNLLCAPYVVIVTLYRSLSNFSAF